jgi:signal transduction histidine kinase
LDLPAQQLLGRSPLDLTGDIVDAAERAAILSRLGDALNHNVAFTLHWAKKTLSANFAPVHINSGRQRGVVGVFRDVTREAELDRMKSIFVSMVSHELRTPINAILGYSEILRERVYGPLTDKQANLVERLLTNTQRLLGLVNDLLDRTQLEAGQLSLRQIEFSVPKLLDDASAVVANMARTKGLEVTTEVAADLPETLEGDPRRLGQILINLVSNAIKFTDHGTISVRLARPDAAHWLMEVADTGRGIPLDEQAHVFDWFHQVDSSATREQAGVGLGLSRSGKAALSP